MPKKSGSIDLSSVRVINGVIPSNGFASVELLSADLSGNTTIEVQISVGGTNFDVARDPTGTDITETLVQAATLYFSFNGSPGDYYKLSFGGATTGTVAYNINSL